MKKYMLMLAIALIASPAMAQVDIIAVDADGAGAGLVANISYNVAGEPNNVAAFALDIVVDAGTIVSIGDFHTGVSTAGDAGYGIFPASFDRYITVNGNGDVDDWAGAGGAYSPAAELGDKGAQDGIGTAGVTVELGALYKGEPNAPLPSDLLLTVTCSEKCNLSVTLNEIRGNVVLEGAGAPSSVDLSQATAVLIDDGGGGECFTPADPEELAQWVAMGKPECWCVKTHCHGDADGLIEGSSKKGFFRVHFLDLNLLLSVWDIEEKDGVSTMVGNPGICADFDHAQEGSSKKGIFRVHFEDLNILLASWNLEKDDVASDCDGTSIDPAAGTW